MDKEGCELARKAARKRKKAESEQLRSLHFPTPLFSFAPHKPWRRRANVLNKYFLCRVWTGLCSRLPKGKTKHSPPSSTAAADRPAARFQRVKGGAALPQIVPGPALHHSGKEVPDDGTKGRLRGAASFPGERPLLDFSFDSVQDAAGPGTSKLATAALVHVTSPAICVPPLPSADCLVASMHDQSRPPGQRASRASRESVPALCSSFPPDGLLIHAEAAISAAHPDM